MSATYYASAQLGFALTFPSSPLSVIWPPNALVFVALLLMPLRMWWFVLLAVAPAHMLVAWQNGLPVETALGLYGTNCAEALLAAALMRRFAGGPPWLVGLRRMIVYVGSAVIVAPLVTSFLDAGVQVVTGWGHDYWLLWQERLLSDALTFLTVPPALLLAVSLGRSRAWRIPLLRAAEAALLALGIFAAGVVVFGPFGPGPIAQPTIVYETLPLLLWASIRFGVGGTSAALLAVTLFSAIRSASHSTSAGTVSSADILMLQAQLLAMSIPILWLAAVIQERKQAQQALRESWEHYRAFFNLAAVGASEADPATGRVLRVNDALCQITGYPREEMLRLSFRELTHPEDRDEDWRQFRRAVEDGVAPRRIEKRYVRKDGQIIWVQVDSAFVRDEVGQPFYTATIIQDITERKHAEEALRTSEERFRAAFESAGTGMVLVDTTGRVVQVNRPYCALIGYSEEELCFHSFAEYTHPDDLETNLALFRRALAGEIDSYHLEKRYIHKQGHVVWGIMSAGAVRDDTGHLLYIVGQVQDITERKQAEEAFEQLTARLLHVQDEERRRLARDLHDGTAQTLTAIDLNLTTLRELTRGGVRDPQRFERLLADSQALGEQAIREIRTMSYLLHPPRLDEAGLIPAVQWYVKGFSQRSGISVDLVVQSDLGRLPAAVESALFRIIQECLTNVHRHSGSSTARIVLKRTQSAMHLAVADLGRGMSNLTPATHGASLDDVHELGVGIPGMRWRMRQLGGWLGIRSTRQGTVVMAMVPISRATERGRTAVRALTHHP